MHALITFALEMEFAPWRRMRPFTRVAPAGPAGAGMEALEMYEARIGRSMVRVVVTGMGPQAARQAVNAALGPETDACVVCGLTGALRRGFARSEVVVASQVREVESQRVLKSDAGLMAQAVQLGATPVTVCTATYIAGTMDAKQRMSAMGDMVDMESFAVMEEAANRGIPAAAIRTISDLVDDEVPDGLERIISSRGEIQPVEAIATILGGPQRLPGLLRFGWHSKRAAKELAGFLDRFAAMESLNEPASAAMGAGSAPLQAGIG